MKFLPLILCVILSLTNVQAGKVLFYIPMSTKSVKITFIPLLEALAEKGHDVTVAMPFAAPKDAKYQVINTDPNGDLENMITSFTEKLLTKEETNVMNAMVAMVQGALNSNDNALSSESISNDTLKCGYHSIK